jgi:NADPH-dependent glutamate synthase beta subunit-like oxidoreductase
MYKVELVVGPELRSVQMAVFQALVTIGGIMKFDIPPRRKSERIAQEALRTL